MLNTRSVTGRAVVIGAGVMGAQIAAHLANIGWQVDLLDVLSEAADRDVKARNALAIRGLERAQQTRPPAFYLPDFAKRIRPGNTTDHLDRITTADWVLEAVVEKLDVKRGLLASLEAYLGPQTLITTNTSGLSIREMADGCSRELRSRFFGTHFFNPPRYMKLLEVIPTTDTPRELVENFTSFAETILGKRVVIAKDTPGFIANRIGVWAMLRRVRAALEYGLTVEQVDTLTGPLIGHPRSATFRLSDICGLDITVDVARHLYERLPDDRWRATLALPHPIQQLMAEGRLGEKSGAGFYRREPDRTILALDWETMDYRPRREVVFPSVEGLKFLPLVDRLRALVKLNDVPGRFLWETTRDILCYTAEIASEIADDIITIDNACKWGFHWELGPFETWDALGVVETAERIQAAGEPIPPLVSRLLESGQTSFYRRDKGQTYYVDLSAPSKYRSLVVPPCYIILQSLKEAGAIIKQTADATLVDLGDGINGLEFHTKMNVLGPSIVEMIAWSLEETERNGRALVIGNQGEHFSAGYNLQLLLMGIYEQDWEEMLASTRRFQEVGLRLKRANVPVIAAVHGYTLGGGLEVALHCALIQAAAESYIGLPETGVGVIPAGGGTTEMLVRATEKLPADGSIDPYPFVHRVFELIGLAKVSTSAEEARHLGYLRPFDGITINTDRLLYDAKCRAMSLAETGYRPAPPAQVYVMGADGFARFALELHILHRAGHISEHDQRIGRELAGVLCGGALVHPQIVSEEYLLALEREAFVRLCSTPKTAERIKAMLETGKPLMN
jgi:3-hydroxyacyl-CoA dehydrogenase